MGSKHMAGGQGISDGDSCQRRGGGRGRHVRDAPFWGERDQLIWLMHRPFAHGCYRWVASFVPIVSFVDELAEVVRQSGRDCHQVLKVALLPAAGSA